MSNDNEQSQATAPSEDSEDMGNHVTDYEILEQSIDTLIEQYQRAKVENVALQKKVQSLTEEKVRLLKKMEEARQRTVALVEKIKNVE